MSTSSRSSRTGPAPDPVDRPPRPGIRRWRSVVALVAFVVLLGGGVFAAARHPSAGAEVLVSDGLASAPVVAPAAASPAVSPSPSPSPSPVPDPPLVVPPVTPVLALSGPVPSAGRGTFGYDDRPAPVLGRAGVLRRFRVAVENGSGEDVAAFGDAVQAALAGPGSWVDSGRLRLQRVPGTARYDFTVFLATAGTAGRMCLAGGTDIRVGGRPYTSCRAPGQVIINLDRWRLSVPHLVKAGLPLERYRLYVINHEVGHQLGHHHERCPGVGRPAPVMQQQTLFLNGCVANPWPYVGGRRYTGPPV